MNCNTCGQKQSMRDLHAHQAAHQAVRLARNPAHVEATKNIIPAQDERITSLFEEAKSNVKEKP